MFSDLSSDEILATSGDAAAFGTLFDRYSGQVFGFLYRQVWQRQTAEELMSQTFLQALEHIDSFQPERGAFRTWLFRIARNLATDHFRRAKETSELTNLEHLLQSPTDLPREFAAVEELRAVQRVLAQLSPEAREIVRLRIWEDLPHAEIAVLLGKSEANVKMIFSRTTKKLRAELLILLLFIPLFNHFEL